MQTIVDSLRSELYSKPSPGYILNTITDEKLLTLSNKYPEHNKDSLWIGAYLSDLYITEAIQSGDKALHIPMAVERAKKLIKDQGVPAKLAEIILEIITTHHGGEQKHIESKLFKNADCFKFLDPRGVFHIFGAMYQRSELTGPMERFVEAMQYTMFKVEEKYTLVDLDDQLKSEAKELYDHWQYFFARVGVTRNTPTLYSK